MNKKTRNIITALYVVALLSLVTGATYAYFTMIRVARLSPKLEAQTATLNYMLFDAGEPINIYPDTKNFKEGMGNLSSDTFARVYLRHSEGDINASVKYNLLLNIESNNLTYSTALEKPELILEVRDYSGNEVTSIEGLNYVSVVDGKGNTIKGFDITTAKGIFYITKGREITTETELTEKWDAKVTYVNLSESQNNNLGKELKGYIRIEKAE